jgi:hypothetical protein
LRKAFAVPFSPLWSPRIIFIGVVRPQAGHCSRSFCTVPASSAASMSAFETFETGNCASMNESVSVSVAVAMC